MIKVSKFENIFAKQIFEKELLEELDLIKSGEYKDIITRCRSYTSTNDYDSYKALKIKLPIVTFCGTFKNGRKLENLDIYNNLMILDIDHIEGSGILDIKEKLKNDKYLFSVWLSPSGEGLKALVKLDSSKDEHKHSFNSLKQYYLNNYNIELDNSGSDVTRLCFVSWDEDLYINQNSEVYEDKLIPSDIEKDKKKYILPKSKSLSKSAYATEGLNKPEHRKLVQLIIKFLKRKDISITETFDKWFRVALAISSCFSYDLGEKYFLTICEQDKEQHNELESINILKYCYNNRRFDQHSSISLGTVVFYAKEKGFVSKKDRFENKEGR
ncbi:BT4734/BF3469 family protein [Flavobacteriaceae sp. LMIT009]